MFYLFLGEALPVGRLVREQARRPRHGGGQEGHQRKEARPKDPQAKEHGLWVRKESRRIHLQGM